MIKTNEELQKEAEQWKIDNGFWQCDYHNAHNPYNRYTRNPCLHCEGSAEQAKDNEDSLEVLDDLYITYELLPEDEQITEQETQAIAERELLERLQLTKRQRNALQLRLRRYSNSEIAEELGISKRGVERLFERMRERLGSELA